MMRRHNRRRDCEARKTKSAETVGGMTETPAAFNKPLTLLVERGTSLGDRVVNSEHDRDVRRGLGRVGRTTESESLRPYPRPRL